MTTQDNKLDFTGQQIFVGLDISKKSWKTTVLTEELEHKTFSQPPRVEVLVNYLHRHFPGARYHCVYESGFCGFWIHEELTANGINCIVVNPADVPTKHREKAFKTDPVDSRKLARGLRSGELDPLYVPSRRAQEDRSLVRTRLAMARKLTRCKNQIKGLLHFYGIIIPEPLLTGHWSRRFLQWLQQLRLHHATGDEALRALLAELDHLRQTVADLTRGIRQLAHEQPYGANVVVLTSISGISTLTAMVILTELVDIHRFGPLDRLASYAGLAPGEHSSGERAIITGVSHRRNPYLRYVLIEAAWVAVRKDPALMMAFLKLSRRMPKQQAIIRIARKLLNRVRYVLKHQAPYVPIVTD